MTKGDLDQKKVSDIVYPILDANKSMEYFRYALKHQVTLRKNKDRNLARFMPTFREVTSHYFDLSQLQVDGLRSTVSVRGHLEDDYRNSGQLIFTFNQDHAVAQFDIPLHRDTVTLLLQQAMVHPDFQFLMAHAIMQGMNIDFNNVKGIRSVTYYSDKETETTFNGLMIPIMQQGNEAGTLLFTDGMPYDCNCNDLSEKSKGSQPIAGIFTNGHFLGVKHLSGARNITSFRQASCSLNWFNCVMNCTCGATIGSCVIAIAGCIGACCGCATLVSCIPCAGCIFGSLYCMLVKCT